MYSRISSCLHVRSASMTDLSALPVTSSSHALRSQSMPNMILQPMHSILSPSMEVIRSQSMSNLSALPVLPSSHALPRSQSMTNLRALPRHSISSPSMDAFCSQSLPFCAHAFSLHQLQIPKTEDAHPTPEDALTNYAREYEIAQSTSIGPSNWFNRSMHLTNNIECKSLVKEESGSPIACTSNDIQIGRGRKRKMDDDEITDDEEDVEVDEDNEPSYSLIDVRHSNFAKFSKYDMVAEFQIDPAAKCPDEKLEDAFNEMIKNAIMETEKDGKKVEKFGVHLFGKGLNAPVRLNMRPLGQNSAQVLMAELERLSQSEGEDNMDKRTLLLSHPMKLLVTCISLPSGSGPSFCRQFFGYMDKERIKPLNNEDNYCLFYALCLAMHRSDQKRKSEQNVHEKLMSASSFTRFTRNALAQKKMAENLMRDAGINFGEKSYGIAHLDKVQQFLDNKYPQIYRIVAFEHAPELEVKPIWKAPPGGQFLVTVFLENGHWSAIRKINVFFQLGHGNKYCVDCESCYEKEQKHAIMCKGRCYQCSKVGLGPCHKEIGVKKECSDCHRTFFNQQCWANHKPLTCKTWKKCTKEDCGRVYRTDTKQKHECGTSYCRRCCVYHASTRGCFIRPKKIAKHVYRIAVFDVETDQDRKIFEGSTIVNEHVPNYISLRITCTDCADNGEKDECPICGTQRVFDWSEADGADPISDFTEWLLTAFTNKFDTVVWSHNGGRFDSHFVFEYLCRTSRRPEVLMQGLKIYEFKVQQSPKHSKIVFRDSYLLWSIPLAQLPSAFGLNCQDKPFFPYLFNVKSNFDVHLNCLPAQKYYAPESMSEKKHAEFLKWYEENKQKPFFLPDELRLYTRNDTEILMSAVLAFRRIFMDNISKGADVMYSATTLAGICMQIYKSMFLKDEEIAIVPEKGFERSDTASVIAIKYCEFRGLLEDVKVCHAGNGAEIRHNGKKIDCLIPAQNKALEVFGCYYHGCLKCFRNDDLLVDKRTAKELNDESWKRIEILRTPDETGNVLDVETIWECEINEQLKHDSMMRDFFDDLGNEKGPIDPRSAYAGGRTGPTALFARACNDKKISVFDIVSLYPFCQFTTLYPIGIPSIIRPKASETKVLWSRPSDIPYKGLLKVRVIPPRKLLHPVLPLKIGGQLIFCTCFRCAQHFQKAQNRLSDYKCPHCDKQRAFVTTVTHLELEEALRQNYIVERFYRAWHFDKFSDHLFKEYVRLFLRLKVEASGWPNGVQTDEQKRHFVEQYKEKYGLEIRIDKVAWNPGLRYIAKICLNSLWGKFSMRNNLGKNLVTKIPAEFYKLVYDHRVEIHQATKMSEDCLRVNYCEKNEFASEHSCSNILISLWTTSAARLVLLKYMNEIENTPGAKLLYTDTDSCVVLHDRDVSPLQTGDFLGMMQEEFCDFEIEEFCSGGPKQWGLQMKEKCTGNIKYLLKMRGITFDMHNCRHFHYLNFKEMIMNYGRNEPHVFRYRKFGPGKNSRITTRDYQKRYLPVLKKGIVLENFDVLPFGFQ